MAGSIHKRLLGISDGQGEDYGIYIRCTGKTDDLRGRPQDVPGRICSGK